ncbi:hypothetical protein LSH36_237g00007 [Paralvinella palmiformis]|uniref:CRAL-TRIO domain-containing protein n=1 Tax=Paralvinella palmiformis TaxID=53620 RepID=A0AAD9JLQ4_9ANNE|nr:hypothetical protein LSH36_237g00007 [Paralvinella palmiformis]
MGFKFVKDDFKFQVVMFSSVEELHAHIDRDQLTEDVGGSLSYNHQEWIQHRACYRGEGFRLGRYRSAKWGAVEWHDKWQDISPEIPDAEPALSVAVFTWRQTTLECANLMMRCDVIDCRSYSLRLQYSHCQSVMD